VISEKRGIVFLAKLRFETRAIPFIIRKGRLEPCIQNLFGDGDRRCPQAQRQHIRMIPDTRPARCFSIMAQCGTDTAHLVGGNTRARACPAADNRLVRFAVDDIMTTLTQLANEKIGQLGTLITAQCNTHTPPPAFILFTLKTCAKRLSHCSTNRATIKVALFDHMHAAASV